jgi:hypothetical protein
MNIINTGHKRSKSVQRIPVSSSNSYTMFKTTDNFRKSKAKVARIIESNFHIHLILDCTDKSWVQERKSSPLLSYFRDIKSTQHNRSQVRTLVKSGKKLYRCYNNLYLINNPQRKHYNGLVDEEGYKMKGKIN